MTLDLSGLEPGTDYALKIKRRDGGKVIETVEFRTAPPARSTGTVRFVLGSCANSTIQKRVDTFDAIAREQPDFAILCGDNGSYYYNGNLSATSEPYTGGSDFPDDDDRHRVDDWDSVPLMLKRQLKARNHPQFVNVAGKVPLFTTWDDHDCGYNNVSAALNAKFPNWVGMHKAASVYRAMWTHGYRNPDDLYYHFRWGPVHVFMTDGRFYRDSGAVLGRDQLDCLIADLEASEAPLKIVVSGNVVLHDHKEFLPAAEKDRLLEELRRPERGRVLLLSGDVHFSECNYDDAEGRVLVEVTSSPLQLKASDKKSRRDTDTGPHRLWQTRVSDQPKLVGTYALIEVNIRAATGTSIEDGEVKVTARGRNGAVLANDDGAAKCHTYWDLATGEVRLGE
jgi:phosphodiesterase/alkaline phosphatase D-like protein